MSSANLRSWVKRWHRASAGVAGVLAWGAWCEPARADGVLCATRDVLLGSYDTPGYANGVSIVGGVAYVADAKSGLQMIDVSNPSDPKFLGSYDTPGSAEGVTVIGEVAYVADHSSGLQIIDVSDPAVPAFLGSYNTPSYAVDISVVGDVAYVADFYSGLEIIDVSDPAAPVLLGEYAPLDPPNFGFARSVIVLANVAYVTFVWEGYEAGFYAVYSWLELIDVSDPAAPMLLGDYYLHDYVHGVTVVGSTAYMAYGDWGHAGLRIIDVSNPADPTLLGSCDTPGSALDVCVVGDVGYMADGYSLQILDVSNPAAPTVMGSLGVPGPAHIIRVVGNVAYETGGSDGLHIIDISSLPASPLLGSYNTPDSARDVSVVEDVAYVADAEAGLQIIDVSNPAAPVLLGSYDTPDSATAVTVIGEVAYVADHSSGLQIIDVSDPAVPAFLGSYDTPSYAVDISVVGDVAYVADFYSGLEIIDVSDPAAPTYLGFYDTWPAQAAGVSVVGDVAYVAYGSADDSYWGGLHIIDVSDPAVPTLLGSYECPGYAQHVSVVGNVAYVAYVSVFYFEPTGGGVDILDISNPAAPKFLGSYVTPLDAPTIAVVKDVAYIADEDTGLQILNVSNPAAPKFLGSYVTSYTNGISVVGDVVYLAGSPGIQIIDVSDCAPPLLDLCESAELLAPGAHASDSFGHAVAIAGDNMIVGAFRDDTGGDNAGAGHVFTQTNGHWFHAAKLLAADAQAGDFFGYCASASGTGAIIGAPRADPAGTNSGAAYIFRHNDGLWTQETRLVPDDGSAGDQFGYSVALLGDTALVGAWMEDLPGRSNAGAAYIFARENGVWVQKAKLTADDAASGDLLGSSVALSDTFACVGAPGDDNGQGTDAGALYVYSLEGGQWVQRAKLIAPGAQQGDEFGFSVAADGPRALVGAPGSDVAAVDAGAAWFYIYNGQGWNVETAATLSAAQPGDAAGLSVALCGQLALIGAWMSDWQGVDSGAAVLFVRDGQDWLEAARLTGKSIKAGDLLGASVGIGPNTLAAGAIHADGPGGPEQGAVLVYSTNGCPCYADFTGDGALDLFDFLAYVNAFNAGEQTADCDHNGGLDLFDFLCFVNAFNAGC